MFVDGGVLGLSWPVVTREDGGRYVVAQVAQHPRLFHPMAHCDGVRPEQLVLRYQRADTVGVGNGEDYGSFFWEEEHLSMMSRAVCMVIHDSVEGSLYASFRNHGVVGRLGFI